MTNTAPALIIGYARVSTTSQSIDQQTDALTEAGVEKVYSDKLSGSAGTERPGLAAALDHARPGDTLVVIGIDRLGRSVAEVMSTVADLLERGIHVRCIREGVDSSTPTGRAIMGIMASLAELELELGKERRAASREARKARGQHVGRPKALPKAKAEQLVRMARAGEPVAALAETFGISRASAYRIVKDANDAALASA
ncbi:recombinase family protein [Tsukamurella paurometabola]|uniref:Recombinase family protein n=1 Tax=Tsukamurella paurometabola TaxID=2061 RepID=A0ABS5NHY8_TSUPA|nr:recombinase family protein [Tsukamurella paurometabola]MBS4103890.1 recombinase family protein [Tsukamurella paurometabola]